MDGRIIVLLNGETVQALAMGKWLKKAGYRVWAVCDDKVSYGYNSPYAERKIIAPPVHEAEDDFHEFFLGFINKNHIDGVIPMNDYSASYLSKHKDVLSEKVRFVIPDWNTFITAYDKNRLMEVCHDGGFPHPATIDLSKMKADEACVHMRFPALIKPNITTGGRGFALVQDATELKAKLPSIQKAYGDCHLQEFIPAGRRQFKVSLFMDKEHRVVNTTVFHKVRFYPENGGSSCCSVSVVRPDLQRVCTAVLEKIGWYGFADFDMIEDPRDGIVKIMEINPRVPACVKLSLVSGVNFAANIADTTIGKKPEKYNYSTGQVLRYSALDALWFLYSRQRFKTKPGWFNFFGRKVHYQDYGGIRAFMVGNFAGFIKQLSPSFRKAKAGLR